MTAAQATKSVWLKARKQHRRGCDGDTGISSSHWDQTVARRVRLDEILDVLRAFSSTQWALTPHVPDQTPTEPQCLDAR